jgi:AcrR family transcriptional regulator
MPPAERRAAIVAATIPLLIEHGVKVTTRQIAEAAGIAEGTIFRVFPDKDSLVEAAVETAFDRAPLDAALRSIDLTLDLEGRLCDAVAIIQRRVADIWKLMSAVGMTRPPEAVRSGDGRLKSPVSTALAELFEPDRGSLRRDPSASAQLLQSLVFASSHPALAEEPLPPAEIVSVLLDGIRAPERGTSDR